MSAVREFINLNGHGQHLKPSTDVQWANGGVAGAGGRRRPSRETVFLFTVILVQTVCMVVGFIVFAYFVDKQFDVERKSRMHLSEKLNCLSNEIELLKKNLTAAANVNRTAQNLRRADIMPPLHGKAEVMKVVTVETVEQYPEIENAQAEAEYDEDSDEDDDLDEEPQAADNAEVYINGNSGSAPTNLNEDISRLRDHQARHLDVQPKPRQPQAAGWPARNVAGLPAPLANQNTLRQLPDDADADDDDDEYEDDLKQTADIVRVADGGPTPTNGSLRRDAEAADRPLQPRIAERQQPLAAARSARNTSRPTAALPRTRGSDSAKSDRLQRIDDGSRSPAAKAKLVPIKETEMLRKNTNRGDDRRYSKPRVRRSAPEKRHVNPVQDSGQPRLNSINPTAYSPAMDSIKDSSSAAINVWSWPAAHFNSHDLSSLERPYSADDCPREIQNNQKKWAPSEVPGSEHFDLKNYENITVKKEGLYLVYSQIYFYKDRSIFGYLIKRENQAVLQCSIHTPTNRTSNGSGTTCYTAGLVYLRANDVLRLEIFNESGKCVRWGPGKSFIGLYKLPVQDSSTF